MAIYEPQELGGGLLGGAVVPGDTPVFCDAPRHPKLVAAVYRDNWESTVTGLRACKISFGGQFEAGMTAGLADYIQERLATHNAEYVLTRVPAQSIQLALHLQDQGFQVLETLLVFSALSRAVVPHAQAGELTIRNARDTDLDACLDMICLRARSRYEIDPMLGPVVERRAYRSWLLNSLAGREAFVVAERRGEPAGFVTWQVTDSRSAAIGLVAVAATATGLGVGRTLLAYAAEQLALRHVDEIRVGTSGANPRAQRLYVGVGFSPLETYLTLRKGSTRDP